MTTSWILLPPELQIRWTLEYIKHVYCPLFHQLIFTFEISTNYKLHCHILGLILDKYDAYNLLHVRGRVNCNSFALRSVKFKNIITSNYIHLVEKPEKWLDYIVKDDNFNPFYIYHYIDFVRDVMQDDENVIPFDRM